MALAARDAPKLEPEIHVLPNPFPRKQGRLLEDDAAFGSRARDRFSIDQDNTSLRRLEAGDSADEARLSATRRAEDGEEIAGTHRE